MHTCQLKISGPGPARRARSKLFFQYFDGPNGPEDFFSGPGPARDKYGRMNPMLKSE